MGKKDKKQRRRPKDSLKMAFWDSPDNNIAREKQKARDLRKTAWWRKKIASGKCHYCQKEFSAEELTMDHVIPLARGGKSERINLVPACKECNNKKKYLLPIEWDEYLNSIK